jgi:integrase
MRVPKWLEHSIFMLALDFYGDYIPEGDGGALNTLPGASSTREAS